MARQCEICGKKPMVGANVSHAHNVTKRRFNPNLQRVRAVRNGKTQTLYACTWAGLFKSTDGAGEWTWIFPTEQTEDDDPTPVSFVAVDPADGQVLYIGIGDADANGDGRGEVYAALFEGTRPLHRVADDVAADPVAFATGASGRAGGRPVLFAGTGAGLYRQLIETGVGDAALFADGDFERPGPSAMAALAERGAHDGTPDLSSLRPVYLRGV